MGIKKYCVNFDFKVSGGSVIIEAESKKEAEQIVRKQFHFNLGELENNDSLCDKETLYVNASLID